MEKISFSHSIKFLIGTVLFMTCLNLSAEWVPKIRTDGKKTMTSSYLSYITTNEAYASSSRGVIYYTKDNFKTFEEINSDIPITERVEFFEMTSRTSGTIVTRKLQDTDSTFVYITKNGGYAWSRVKVLPVPNPPLRNLGQEKLFLKRKNQKLFILWGDVICYGEMSGSEWNIARFNIYRIRENENSTFYVVNDSIWAIEFFAVGKMARYYTSNKGETWSQHSKYFPSNFDKFASIGSSFQAFDTYHEAHIMYEYSFDKGEWVELFSNYGMQPKHLLQLSDSILLIDYWHWLTDTRRNGVYNRSQKKWIELDSISRFFPENQYSSYSLYQYWVSRGSGFVAFNPSIEQFEETLDYGQTWTPLIPDFKTARYLGILDMNFYENIAIAKSFTPFHNDVLYSLDGGELWQIVELDSFCEETIGSYPCNLGISYQSGTPLYFTGDKTGKIKENNGRLYLEEALFSYGDSVPYIYDVSDLGVDETYMTGRIGDSLYLFKSNSQEQLTDILTIEYEINGRNHRLVQNQKWVVFALGSYVFSYNKLTTEINLLRRNVGGNGSMILEFLGEDSIYINDHNTFRVIFDLQNNIGEDIRQHFPFYVSASASNGKDELMFCSFYTLYKTDLPFFQESTIDSEFIYMDQIRVMRYWNGSFWAGGTRNLYKKEVISRNTENLCYEIEFFAPNPFHNNFNVLLKIKTTENISFSLYNSLGQLVQQSEEGYNKGLYEKSFNLEHLAKGIYYLKISSSCGNNQFLKLIKDQ